MNKNVKEAIILANGRFPRSREALEILNDAEYIVCCDGSVAGLEGVSKEPYAIVGDLDSLSQELKEKYEDKLYLWKDQNMNDLTKAVKWAVKQGFEKLKVLGATGKREDHTIGNFYLITEFSKWVDIEMFTDYARVVPINETTTFKSFKGQQISVFSSHHDTSLSYHGLKYPVKEINFPMPWMGTLNESLGDEFTIEIDKEGVLVYLLF